MTVKKPKATKAPSVDNNPDRERAMQLERELQLVRLELEETNLSLNAARHDLELLKNQSRADSQQDLHAMMEKLYEALSGPVTQLMVQDHMLNVQGKSIPAADIQAGCNRLLRALEKHGLDVQGAIGDKVRFDENFHEPLAVDQAIDHGEEVIVRICGLSYQGKVLRRAGVTKESLDSGEI